MASLIIVRKQELPKQKHQIRGLPRELSTLRIESNEVYQYPVTRYSLFAQPIKAFSNLNREEPHAMKVAFFELFHHQTTTTYNPFLVRWICPAENVKILASAARTELFMDGNATQFLAVGLICVHVVLPSLWCCQKDRCAASRLLNNPQLLRRCSSSTPKNRGNKSDRQLNP